MSISKHHSEWLSLIEVSGPFLTLPVLERVFPQGMDPVDSELVGRLKLGREEWIENQSEQDAQRESIHRTWIDFVLHEILELGSEVLKTAGQIPKELLINVPEHHATIRPDFLIVNPQGAPRANYPRLLVQTWPVNQDLEKSIQADAWSATPKERMTLLCRSTGIRLGLVTNGDHWMLVDAPEGETPGYASWYANIWTEERSTLSAFRSLLGARRFFSVADTDTLEEMLHESTAYQEEVTTQLGAQVRKAVEVLIQALNHADLDRKGKLLEGVPPERLYEASLTVMMRLVFLFCAEERGLLLLGQDAYDAHYSVSYMRSSLREEADRIGLEVLEHRQDAWSRLLAIFRAIYGGIEHEALRLPALGSSLFDPDRFPFLEGRPLGSSWLDVPAQPLPIDNRTVLHLLESLQLLQMKSSGGSMEARRLSFRALDVEQIGHVYESLLDHLAVRVEEITLALNGARDMDARVSLEDLDSAHSRGREELVTFLKEQTGRSQSAIQNDLSRKPDETARERLLVSCGNNHELLEKLLPYHALIREDVWGYPQVYMPGSFMVTSGQERRETGTHYTPKVLTEKIVTQTLEPIVYIGPAEGKNREEWKLRSPEELHELKICDPAMGSGAFLVQTCRWLAERLVESWEEAGASGLFVKADGRVLTIDDGKDPLPKDKDERISIARRLIVERCVYGVDINPMAVEMAKLSLWLVTMAKGQPFEFLDHNLRCGDSLLGIWNIAQLEKFHTDPERGEALHRTLFKFTKHIEPMVQKALELRRRLYEIRINDIEDVRYKNHLNLESKRELEKARIVADLLIGATISTAGDRETVLDRILKQLSQTLDFILGNSKDEDGSLGKLTRTTRELLDTECPDQLRPRRPFHWPIEFPEVFSRENAGFDAFIGNPPFLGGKRISTVFGTKYNSYLKTVHPSTNKNTDLCAHFFLRSFKLLRDFGNFGLLATNSISEGDTRKGGLEWLVTNGGVIYSAFPNESWPGKASVFISRMCIHKGKWNGAYLLKGKSVPTISAILSDQEEWIPKRLAVNQGIAFTGSYLLGMGFVLNEEDAQNIINRDSRNREVLFPYLNGEDFNSHPKQKPSRWVVCFWDWAEEKASTYLEPFRIVLHNVKPERMQKPENTIERKKWWQFARPRPELYHAIGRGYHFTNHPNSWDPNTERQRYVLCFSQVSKYFAPLLVNNEPVFDQRLVVLAGRTYYDFALLCSSLHKVWARKYSSTLATRLTYNQSEVFESFPFPFCEKPLVIERISLLGTKLQDRLTHSMSVRTIGITDLLNLIHRPSCHDSDIQELRELLSSIDTATLEAYDWTNIDLGHAFHDVPYLPDDDRIRFTITEDARREILGRLSKLNRERYEEEVKQGLQD